MLPAETQDIDKDHTLQRLKAAILDRVDGPDGEEVESAIRTLQTVNGLRVGQQHSGAIKEKQNAFDALGIRYPVDDWDRAWARVRSAAAVEGPFPAREFVTMTACWRAAFLKSGLGGIAFGSDAWRFDSSIANPARPNIGK